MHKQAHCIFFHAHSIQKCAKSLFPFTNDDRLPNRSPACNSTYKKLAVQCSADTFPTKAGKVMVNQTLVHRINLVLTGWWKLPASWSCKLYWQIYDDWPSNNKTDRKTDRNANRTFEFSQHPDSYWGRPSAKPKSLSRFTRSHFFVNALTSLRIKNLS